MPLYFSQSPKPLQNSKTPLLYSQKPSLQPLPTYLCDPSPCATRAAPHCRRLPPSLSDFIHYHHNHQCLLYPGSSTAPSPPPKPHPNPTQTPSNPSPPPSTKNATYVPSSTNSNHPATTTASVQKPASTCPPSAASPPPRNFHGSKRYSSTRSTTLTISPKKASPFDSFPFTGNRACSNRHTRCSMKCLN